MYSIQTAVSDGTLTILALSIEYPRRDYIHVYFDGVEQTEGDTWDWVGVNDKAITFSPAVPDGVVVRVQRITPLDTVPNIFGSATPPYVGYAEFDADTVDENFRQTLQVAQESTDRTDEAIAASQYAINTSILAQSVAAGAVATANAASSAASAAQSSAATAISTANNAVSIANDATSDAASAVSTANAATSTANTALSTANTALSTSNSAASDAADAVSTANNAASTAASAVSTANSAVDTANAATSTANDAYGIATGIDAKAQQALDDSADAVNTANAIAGTANSALLAANDAVIAANEAVDTANAAQSTASSVAGLANTALDTANNAELVALGAADDAALALSTANGIAGTANAALSAAQNAETTAGNAAAAAAAALKKADNLSDLPDKAAARSSLELGTAAVASAQSLSTDYYGPTEPSSTFPGMTWADSTNLLLKRRNAANDGWIVEGTLFKASLPQYAEADIPLSDKGSIYVIGKGAMEWDSTSSTYKPKVSDEAFNDLPTVSAEPDDFVVIVDVSDADKLKKAAAGGFGFPSGTVMLFYQASAPTGWTKLTAAALNDAVLRIVTGAGGATGGATAFSTFNAQTSVGATTLSTEQMPSHSHDVKNFSGGGGQSVTVVQVSTVTNTSPAWRSGYLSSAGGGSSHTHSFTANIKYADFIVASKD